MTASTLVLSTKTKKNTKNRNTPTLKTLKKKKLPEILRNCRAENANTSKTTTSSILSQTIDLRLSDTFFPVFNLSKIAFTGSATLPGEKLLTVTPRSCTGTTSINFVPGNKTFHLAHRTNIAAFDRTNAAKIILVSPVLMTEISFTGSAIYTMAISMMALKANKKTFSIFLNMK